MAPACPFRHMTKRSIESFLSQYEGLIKPREAKRPKRARRDTVQTSERETREPSKQGENHQHVDTTIEEASVIVRSYATRSKGIPQNPPDDPDDDISQFLISASVQAIHDLPFDEIPALEPSFGDVSRQQAEKAMRKVGFSRAAGLKEHEYLKEVGSIELMIIGGFKFTPLQYADTKRRLFAEKARKTKLGRTFRKTDAQKACRIDVNKTSRLYEVFESIGLLKDNLFR